MGKSLWQDRRESSRIEKRDLSSMSNVIKFVFQFKKSCSLPANRLFPFHPVGVGQSHKSTRKKLSFHSRHIFGMPGGWRWCVWVRKAARTVRKGHEGSKIYGKWFWKDFLWLYTGWMVTKFMHISLTLLAGEQNGGRGLLFIVNPGLRLRKRMSGDDWMCGLRKKTTTTRKKTRHKNDNKKGV